MFFLSFFILCGHRNRSHERPMRLAIFWCRWASTRIAHSKHCNAARQFSECSVTCNTIARSWCLLSLLLFTNSVFLLVFRCSSFNLENGSSTACSSPFREIYLLAIPGLMASMTGLLVRLHFRGQFSHGSITLHVSITRQCRDMLINRRMLLETECQRRQVEHTMESVGKHIEWIARLCMHGRAK